MKDGVAGGRGQRDASTENMNALDSHIISPMKTYQTLKIIATLLKKERCVREKKLPPDEASYRRLEINCRLLIHIIIPASLRFEVEYAMLSTRSCYQFQGFLLRRWSLHIMVSSCLHFEAEFVIFSTLLCYRIRRFVLFKVQICAIVASGD